jgi:hypothetical protein
MNAPICEDCRWRVIRGGIVLQREAVCTIAEHHAFSEEQASFLSPLLMQNAADHDCPYFTAYARHPDAYRSIDLDDERK